MESTSKILAKFLLQGEKGHPDSLIYDLEVEKVMCSQLLQNLDQFQGFLLAKLPKDATTATPQEIWFDFRDIYQDHEDIQEDARVLTQFIKGYEMLIDTQAKSFSGVGDFNRFKKIVTIKRMERLFDLPQLRLSVFHQHPILVLADIGGSILYRCSDRPDTQRKIDFQIKKHLHYFRPSFDLYLASILEHPRVKFAIYSSIMHRNIMPLMFKIFDNSKLKAHKTKVWEIFDQEYNVPDLGEGKDSWATKRKMEKVFENEKVQKNKFGLKNTLMIDSDEEKVRDYPHNSVVIQPYTLEDLLQPEKDESQEILLKAKNFFLQMFEEADDVQEWLKTHPEMSKKDHKSDSQPEEEKKSSVDSESFQAQQKASTDQTAADEIVEALNKLKIDDVSDVQSQSTTYTDQNEEKNKREEQNVESLSGLISDIKLESTL
eukprot:403340158